MRALVLGFGFFGAITAAIAQAPTAANRDSIRGNGATLSPATFTFNATVTATSAPQTLTLSNNSGAAFTV